MTVKLIVPKMSSDDCVSKIDRAVKTVDVFAVVRGNPQTKIISVETKASQIDIEAVIAKVGYPAS